MHTVMNFSIKWFCPSLPLLIFSSSQEKKYIKMGFRGGNVCICKEINYQGGFMERNIPWKGKANMDLQCNAAWSLL